MPVPPRRPLCAGTGGRQPRHGIACRKAEDDQPGDQLVLFRRGDDNGEKHAVERYAERTHKACGQQITGDVAKCRTACPCGHGDQHRAVETDGVELAGACDGDGKDLVGHIHADDEPLEKSEPLGALAERAAHQQIAGVGNERHQRKLGVGGARGNQGEACVFARRGVAEQADDEGLNGVQPRVPRGDAERKGDGKIPEPDRDAVVHPGSEGTPSGFFGCDVGHGRFSPDAIDANTSIPHPAQKARGRFDEKSTPQGAFFVDVD